MLHSLLKRYLLLALPCLLIAMAMMPLTAFAQSASGDQHRLLTAQAVPTLTEIVKDGGFEKPIVSPNPFNEYSAGQTFGKWAVTSGSIDLMGNYWVSAHGAQSVDLNGFDAGTISQQVPTLSGASYALSFDLAGNPACGPITVQMRILWGATVVDTVSFDTTGHSTTSMGWHKHTYQVQATGSLTPLRFVSLTQGSCGPALDAVAVKG